LLIDLSRSRTEVRPVPEEAEVNYPYGAALATYLLGLHQPVGVDPLSEESVVVFVPGLLAGLPYPGATRMAVVGKSPLTGLWAGGTMGGEFAWALARSGWSAVVIQGQASGLIYLFLDEGRAYLRPATTLAGKSLARARNELKETWGRETAVLGVGLAGETRIRFAALSDGTPEAWLRGGLGALFGAKNLKAVAVRPDKAVKIERPAEFLQGAGPLIKSLDQAEQSPALDMGTLRALRRLNQAGALPARNFQEHGGSDEWLEGVERLGARRRSCPGCPLACIRLFLFEGDFAPEILPVLPEHLWAWGPLVGLNSVETTLAILRSCLEYGYDPISLAGTAAWMAECLEKDLRLGLDFGPEAGFGQGSWLAALPEKIAVLAEWREILGQGVRRAAELIGPETAALAVHFRGQELSYLDPRAAFQPLSFLGPALGVPVGRPFPENGVSDEDWCREVIAWEDHWAVLETVGLCPWAAAAQTDFMEHLASLAGLAHRSSLSPEDLKRWGVKLVNLIRVFDWREGWRPSPDELAERFFREELKGPGKTFPALDREAWEKRKAAYHVQRGWSLQGRVVFEV
jgi:aldehyde:ferredoxin oxidoreductase